MTAPHELVERRSRLTPAQRALLEKRLRGAAREPSGADESEAIVPRPEAGVAPAPLSFAQRRLWDFAERRPGSAVHNVFHAVGLAGPLVPAVLELALYALVARHEALRTRFERTAQGPVALAGAPRLALPTVDLSGLPGPSRDAEGLRLVAELARPPFDLARGPLLRTALLRSGEAAHALILAVHHIVIDGWSLALFVRDLAALYDMLASGRPAALPPPALQSADLAVWQRRRLAEGALDAELAWWRSRLAGAPPEGLRWPPRPGAAGGRTSLQLEPALAEALRVLVQRERATPFIVLLAALQALLHRRLGTEDLVVGTPFSLRGRPETAGLVGFLLNLLALRTDLGGDPSFTELLARVRDTALGAFAHREVPFERLAEELCPAAEPGSTPWVRVLFNMPTGGAGHPEAIRAGGLEVQPLLTGEIGSEFDLTFYAREQGGGIRLDLGYNPGLLTAGEAAGLLGELAAFTAEAVAAPERRLSELAGATAVLAAELDTTEG